MTWSAKPVDADQLISLVLNVNVHNYPMTNPDGDLVYTATIGPFTASGAFPYTLMANYGSTNYTQTGTFLISNAQHPFPLSHLNRIFRSVYDRDPTTAEWLYWAKRRQDKPQTDAFLGALQYHHLFNISLPLF